MIRTEAFARELAAVPRMLLDADEAKVLDDGLHALAAIEEEADRTPTIAVVGPSGSGKSWLLNRLVGRNATPTGVLRPTTRAPIPVSGGAIGLDFTDTPPWEHAEDVVRVEMGAADRVVVVLTPSRYADEAVASLLERAGARDLPIVVLNRVSEPIAPDLLADVERLLGLEVVTIFEGGTVGPLTDRLGEVAASRGDGRTAVLAAAAAGAGRFVARTTTERSTVLGRLVESVKGTEVPARSGPLTVLDSWESTTHAIVASVSGLRDAVDHEIGREADRDLLDRFRQSLAEWDDEGFRHHLEEWKLDTDAAFSAGARVRWRRKATRNLIEATAWKSAVNPAVTPNARVRRVMGDRLSDVVVKRFDALTELMESEAEGRLVAWQEAVTDAAAYTPGSLLGAVEEFEAALSDV